MRDARTVGPEFGLASHVSCAFPLEGGGAGAAGVDDNPTGRRDAIPERQTSRPPEPRDTIGNIRFTALLPVRPDAHASPILLGLDRAKSCPHERWPSARCSRGLRSSASNWVDGSNTRFSCAEARFRGKHSCQFSEVRVRIFTMMSIRLLVSADEHLTERSYQSAPAGATPDG